MTDTDQPRKLPTRNYERDVNVEETTNIVQKLGNVVVAATQDTLETVLVIAAALMWLISAAITAAIFLVPEFSVVKVYNNMTPQQLFVWYGHPGMMALVFTNTAAAAFVQNGLGRIDLWGTRLGATVVFMVAFIVVVQINNGMRQPLPGEQLEFLITIVIFGVIDWVGNQYAMKKARQSREAMQRLAIERRNEFAQPAAAPPPLPGQAPVHTGAPGEVIVHTRREVFRTIHADGTVTVYPPEYAALIPPKT